MSTIRVIDDNCSLQYNNKVFFNGGLDLTGPDQSTLLNTTAGQFTYQTTYRNVATDPTGLEVIILPAVTHKAPTFNAACNFTGAANTTTNLVWTSVNSPTGYAWPFAVQTQGLDNILTDPGAGNNYQLGVACNFSFSAAAPNNGQWSVAILVRPTLLGAFAIAEQQWVSTAATSFVVNFLVPMTSGSAIRLAFINTGPTSSGVSLANIIGFTI